MNGLRELVNHLTIQYGSQRESLLPILQAIQLQERHISEEAMVEVARALNLSAAQVFGTATFYSFLVTQPQGKYVIRVCKTITCMMHGKNQILETLESILRIKPGQTTVDGQFTLLETNCLGQCHEGPAMLINEIPYTQLTPDKIRQIIEELMFDVNKQ